MANPQHNIEALGDYVDHPIVEPNIERHFRMCVQKFGKYRGEIAQAKTDRCTYFQHAMRRRPAIGDTARGLRSVGNDLPALFEVKIARFGETDRPRRTIEQSRTQTVLQPRNLFADKRSGSAELARGRGEAARLYHADKNIDSRKQF